MQRVTGIYEKYSYVEILATGSASSSEAKGFNDRIQRWNRVSLLISVGPHLYPFDPRHLDCNLWEYRPTVSLSAVDSARNQLLCLTMPLADDIE